MKSRFDSIESVIADLRKGKMVIIMVVQRATRNEVPLRQTYEAASKITSA